MAIIKNHTDNELISLYDGFDSTMVGIGTHNPDIYKTAGYSAKKSQSIYIGGMSKIRYIGYDLDPEPTVLVIKLLPQYASILAINTRYMPVKLRESVISFILKTNMARIKSNLPIIIDYDTLSRAVPDIKNVVRMYKTVGIKVEETIPLREWGAVVKERSPFEHIAIEGRKGYR